MMRDRAPRWQSPARGRLTFPQACSMWSPTARRVPGDARVPDCEPSQEIHALQLGKTSFRTSTLRLFAIALTNCGTPAVQLGGKVALIHCRRGLASARFGHRHG